MKIILIKLIKDGGHQCPLCHSKECRVNSIYMRTVKHLRIFEYEVIIEFPQYQIKCKEHGLINEVSNFVNKGSSFSNLLKQYIYEVNKVMPNKYTAEYFGASQDTVREIDKQFIEYFKNQRDLNPRILGLDEMSVGSGHLNYIHILTDPEAREVIDIGESRKETYVNKTIEKNREILSKVKYGIIDMWDAFENSIRKFVPDVKIIFDKFHIVKQLQNAMDEIRRLVYRDSKEKEKEVVKGMRYILLSRKKNLKNKAKKNLKQLMKLNKPLYKAYLLKESFFHLWDYKNRKWAYRFFQKWKSQLKWIRLNPLKKFAEMIERRQEGVFNYFDVKGTISLGYVARLGAETERS